MYVSPGYCCCCQGGGAAVRVEGAQCRPAARCLGDEEATLGEDGLHSTHCKTGSLKIAYKL